MPNLPEPVRVVQLPDGTHDYADQYPTAHQPPAPQIVHVHHAPPDRTVHRLALGAGVGGGAVVAGVYCGPLLVAALTAIAANLAVLALIIAVVTWGLVSVVKSVGGADGKAAASTLRRRGRR